MRLADGRGLSVFLVAAILAAGGSVFFGADGFTHLRRLKAERQQLGEDAMVLIRRNETLRDEIARLNGDDLYLEALARRELGLVRPDELVYRFRRTGGEERDPSVPSKGAPTPTVSSAAPPLGGVSPARPPHKPVR